MGKTTTDNIFLKSNTVHSTTEMTPNEAKDDRNSLNVKINTYNKGNKLQRYPPLKPGDAVRTYIKPHTFKKGYSNNWSKEIYKIIGVSTDNKQYMINSNAKRLYNRHELLKVTAVETKHT